MNQDNRSKPRIAILGAGLIGQKHAKLVHDIATLAAIIDPADHSKTLAEEFGVPHFVSLEELFSVQSVDGVIIGTPNQMHLPHAVQCLKSSIPILIEKPLADNVESGKIIADTGEQSGTPILVGHHRRYNPIVRQAKRIIESGELGRLVSVHTTCWLYKPDHYFDVDWRRKPGAGPIFINLIHDVDLLIHLCGRVVSVQAMESNAVRDNEVEDTATILLRFENGVLGSLVVSDAIAAPWSWELCAGENPAYPHMQATSTMLGGTSGSLSIPDLGVWVHEPNPSWWNPMHRNQIKIDHEDPLTLQIKHFSNIINQAEEPLVTARDGLAALKVIDAIKQAAKTETCIKL